MSEIPIVSLLHASKGRPEKALQTMRLWAERATRPEDVQYVFAIEKSDTETDEHLDRELAIANLPFWNNGDVIAVRHNFNGSAPAWDAAYRVSGGQLLIQVSDDFEPVEDWDTAILNRMPVIWGDDRIVVAVSDGLRRDRLLTMAVCTRTYADFKGEFLHKGYQSMFSDDDFTLTAYRHQAEGQCKVIEARDLVFKHHHHCIDPTVPEDDTYRWQNRPEAYDAGKRLFLERHPHAYGKEAKLWM